MLSEAILERLGALSVQETGGGSGEEGSVARSLFDANMLLDCRATLDPVTPAYQECPGIINRGELSYPETFGELYDQDDDDALVVAPSGDDLASKTDYWTADAEDDYIVYASVNIARTIRAYSFITENGYTPATWKVEGSNDGTNWTTLHSGTAPTWDAGKNQVDETIVEGNRAAYTYHRLVVDGFDSGVTAVRIYALQFWNDGITTQLGLRAFASASDPLKFAFGGGVDEGSDVVHEVSLTSPLSLTIDPTETAAHMPPSGASKYPLLVYAEHNPDTEATVLGAEPVNVDDYVMLDDIQSQLIALGWSVGAIGNWTEAIANGFDNVWTTTLYGKPTDNDAAYQFLAPAGVFFQLYGCKLCYRNWSTASCTNIEYTVNGVDWVVAKSHTGVTGIRTDETIFEEPITVNGVRLAFNASPGPNIYELELYAFDIPGIGTAGRKFANNKVWLYDSVEEEWVGKVRVYLGQAGMGKGLDGEWAVTSFVPYQMPRQLITPFPKSVFPARW